MKFFVKQCYYGKEMQTWGRKWGNKWDNLLSFIVHGLVWLSNIVFELLVCCGVVVIVLVNSVCASNIVFRGVASIFVIKMPFLLLFVLCWGHIQDVKCEEQCAQIEPSMAIIGWLGRMGVQGSVFKVVACCQQDYRHLYSYSPQFLSQSQY